MNKKDLLLNLYVYKIFIYKYYGYNDTSMKVMIMDLLENTYSNFLRVAFAVLNPFKKAIIRTQCTIHKFINVQATEILKNDGYTSAYHFFRNYMRPLNDGAVWADQDFKSSQHFYNPTTKKGLYGRKNALDLGKSYYEKSIKLWERGEFEKSLFYFGACVHLVQDLTIPQHANVRLLDDHKQYETFVKRSYQYVKDFNVEHGSILFHSIEDYFHFNGKVAMKIYKRLKRIEDDEKRFYHTTKCILPLAERTTAGCMVLFYKEVFQEN